MLFRHALRRARVPVRRRGTRGLADRVRPAAALTTCAAVAGCGWAPARSARAASGGPRPTIVVVTTDPARDTPTRLRSAAFDPRFAGLTGDFTTFRHAPRGLGVSIRPPVQHGEGRYTVRHGAKVLAFSPTDDHAHPLDTAGVFARRYATRPSRIAAGASA
jgi:protein SCO1/2